MFESVDVQGILSHGATGLGFLLALLAFWILREHQRKPESDARTLNTLKFFMLFSFALCLIGLVQSMDTLDNSKLRNENSQLRVKIADLKQKLAETESDNRELVLNENECDENVRRRSHTLIKALQMTCRDFDAVCGNPFASHRDAFLCSQCWQLDLE